MMKRISAALTVLAMITACTEQAPENAQSDAGESSTITEDAQPSTQNVLPLNIEGMSFVGPSEMKSGWATIRITNNSGMTHFGLVYRLPEGVTAEMVSDQVVKPFQESLTASLDGDFEKAGAIMATMPTWVGDLVYLGGPGMISDGVVGEATMYLEPGNYIVECYVKTNGVQHNYHPEPGQHGMVLPLTVTDENANMPEPDANVTLNISNSGYEISDGEFVSGENSVRVNFVEQRLYNNFIGHDAHVFRITPGTDVAATTKWIDFFPMDGQQTPAPAHFVGGIHDMPEGSIGYFKLDLEPGDYGIVAEIPDAQEAGFFTRFSVVED